MSESHFKNLVNVKVKEYLNKYDFTKISQLLDKIYAGKLFTYEETQDSTTQFLKIIGIINPPIIMNRSVKIKSYLIPLTDSGHKICILSHGNPELYKYNFGLRLKNFN